MMEIYERATEAAEYLQKLLPDSLTSPAIGIICGSGLGGLANTVGATPQLEVAYTDIPHFPPSTVQGHAGKLLFGSLGNSSRPIVMMVGRLHFFEGHSIQDITFPVRVLKILGVSTLIVTNAAGGLNPDYCVGDLVIINDHLNLAGLSGCHPLRGPNVDLFGPRFPPLSDAYDLELRRTAHRVWNQLNVNSRTLYEGVYAFVGGPSYETRAECRFLRSLGADLVGMSTVPEVIVARHSSMRILAVSLVTNNAVIEAGPAGNDTSIDALDQDELRNISEGGKANHQEVLEAGQQAAAHMERWIYRLVDQLQ